MRKTKVPILAVIPARGGSKGIKRKNLALLRGRPLIAYALDALAGCKYAMDSLVSTEDEEIKKVAERYGGKVPFMRPQGLATDEANIVDVVEDILKRLPETYEYVCLLQPTAPLRTAKDIEAAVEIALRKKASSVCSFVSVDSEHPWLMHTIIKGKLTPFFKFKAGLPRQKFPPALLRNGAIYITRVADFRREKAFITKECLPYIMPPERSVNVNGEFDMKLAEIVLQEEERCGQGQQKL